MNRTSGKRLTTRSLPSDESLSTTMTSNGNRGGCAKIDSRHALSRWLELKFTMQTLSIMPPPQTPLLSNHFAVDDVYQSEHERDGFNQRWRSEMRIRCGYKNC